MERHERSDRKLTVYVIEKVNKNFKLSTEGTKSQYNKELLTDGINTTIHFTNTEITSG